MGKDFFSPTIWEFPNMWNLEMGMKIRGNGDDNEIYYDTKSAEII